MNKKFNSFKGILKTTGKLKEEMQQMKTEEKKLEEKKLMLLEMKNKK